MGIDNLYIYGESETFDVEQLLTDISDTKENVEVYFENTSFNLSEYGLESNLIISGIENVHVIHDFDEQIL